MKIAFTARGEGQQAQMDDKFGRAPWFVIVQTDSAVSESICNPSLSAGSGAGVQSADFLSRQNVEAVVTTNVGPKAARALAAAGLDVYRSDFPTVAENLQAFENDALHKIDEPTTGSGRGKRRGRRF